MAPGPDGRPRIAARAAESIRPCDRAARERLDLRHPPWPGADQRGAREPGRWRHRERLRPTANAHRHHVVPAARPRIGEPLPGVGRGSDVGRIARRSRVHVRAPSRRESGDLVLDDPGHERHRTGDEPRRHRRPGSRDRRGEGRAGERALYEPVHRSHGPRGRRSWASSCARGRTCRRPRHTPGSCTAASAAPSAS